MRKRREGEKQAEKECWEADGKEREDEEKQAREKGERML